MKKLYKWVLDVMQERPTLEMPSGTQVLTVQVQHSHAVLWALVDSDALPVIRRFVLVGTGHEVPEDAGRYVGTVQLDNGALVVHVFEAVNPYV